MELGIQALEERDGRAAYMDLKKHYLGSSFVAKTISDATTELKTIFYTTFSNSGESASYSFFYTTFQYYRYVICTQDDF